MERKKNLIYMVFFLKDNVEECLATQILSSKEAYADVKKHST